MLKRNGAPNQNAARRRRRRGRAAGKRRTRRHCSFSTAGAHHTSETGPQSGGDRTKAGKRGGKRDFPLADTLPGPGGQN